MLALAALSSTALLSGSVLAEGASADPTGSKTYTFVFGVTLDSELGVSLNNQDNIGLSEITHVPFYYSEQGVYIDGATKNNPVLTATTLKDFKISTNDSNSKFNISMRLSKPMTYDDGSGAVPCTNQCGNIHDAWFSGRGYTGYTMGQPFSLTLTGIRAGEQLPQFVTTHEAENPRVAFAKGTYTEEWQMVITPSI